MMDCTMRKILTFVFLTYLMLSGHFLYAQYADCSGAREICDKSAVHISKPRGEGQNRAEADFIHCFMNGDNNGQAEENSTWIKFEIKESGTISFIITPDDPGDDIDFVVYRLPSNGNCDRKEIVRCMASGARGSIDLDSPCMGPTGLRAGELDTSEDAGCNDKGDNTWLAPLKTIKGEHYVILISNVTAPRGWTLRLGGSAKLPCEKPPKKKDPPPTKEKDKPKKTTPVPPVPVVQAPPPPKEINGRTVEVGETVKIYNRRIRVTLWDSQVEDGDVVSLFIGEKKVLDHYLLRAKPEEFVFELPAGKEHYLTIYADDFGKSEPNTASVIINDGVSEQRIDLVAGRKKQESVKIVLE